MILIENTEVCGWAPAIRGMRNPKNSWSRSDTVYGEYYGGDEYGREVIATYDRPDIGLNDHQLMMNLAAGGPVHAKYRRMITVYADIAAPLYWWKEYDTYKVGTVANSCSTMHKIHDRPFVTSDFSCEHLLVQSEKLLQETIDTLNYFRERFVETGDKDYWWQLIQLLPSSYNQKRTIMTNYEVLCNQYFSRRNHKLDEWHDYCRWIENLPYSEIITGDYHE